MANESQIAQVLGTLPNLTQEQIDQLAKSDVSSLAVAENEAELKQEYEVQRRLSVVSTAVPFEVFTIARLAILGILAEDMSLTVPWTSVVGDFKGEVLVEEPLPLEPEVVEPVAEVAEVVDGTRVEPLDEVAPVADPEAGVI